jgi:hypothetical protein
MACLMVLSLEVTSSWKYDRRELKKLLIVSFVSLQRSSTTSKIIALSQKLMEAICHSLRVPHLILQQKKMKIC